MDIQYYMQHYYQIILLVVDNQLILHQYLEVVYINYLLYMHQQHYQNHTIYINYTSFTVIGYTFKFTNTLPGFKSRYNILFS